MKQPQRQLPDEAPSKDFTFTGQARIFPPVRCVPFRWPTKIGIANDYIESWHSEARAALASLKLSTATLGAVASHISRRDGTTTLTDGALSARTGRSLKSTERDVQRLKQLGYLIAEVQLELGRRGKVRTLKPSLPDRPVTRQRIPAGNSIFFPSTYPPYVGGIDIGERRDV